MYGKGQKAAGNVAKRNGHFAKGLYYSREQRSAGKLYRRSDGSAGKAGAGCRRSLNKKHPKGCFLCWWAYDAERNTTRIARMCKSKQNAKQFSIQAKRSCGHESTISHQNIRERCSRVFYCLSFFLTPIKKYDKMLV